MSNRRISDLNSVAQASGVDVLPIVNLGSTRKISLEDLFTYVDNSYFKDNYGPSVNDNLNNSYNEFKIFYGNVLSSGAQVFRVRDGRLEVDNQGYFKNFLSGNNVFIKNINIESGNSNDHTVNTLHVTGNLDHTDITGSLKVSGYTTFDSGVIINRSSLDNSVKFGPNIKVHASGAGRNFLATDAHLMVEKNIFGDELHIAHGAYLTGYNIRLAGTNVILGYDNNSSLTFNGGFTSNIAPANDWLNPADTEFYDLGYPTQRWRTIWAGRGIFHDFAHIRNELEVTGNASIKTNLFVSGDANITGNLIIGSGSSVLEANQNNIFLNKNSTISGSLTITGIKDTRLDGSLYVNSGVYLSGVSINLGEILVTGDKVLTKAEYDQLKNYSDYISGFTVLRINNQTISGAKTFLNDLSISGNVRITGDLGVTGHFSARSKAFLIEHPLDPTRKLQYGSLEGPENGVYLRGKTDKNIILLPNYWKGLVDENSITVHLTPSANYNELYVIDSNNEKVTIGGNNFNQYYYIIYGERKDIPKLAVEI